MATESVTAPMPGVFYRRPDPEEPPFVEVGDEVTEGEKVGLVGVMKNFHDINAPADGTIAAINFENEEAVEAGDEVIEIETA